MPDTFQKRIPFTKVDEAHRIVSGIVTAEVRDRSRETMHYAKSKPRYEEWSNTFQKATDGKSVGNLRSMHGLVAAGVGKSISFNDDGKYVHMSFEVVDDNEWEKVQKGVYTGFSHGGDYGARWTENGQKYYEAIPVEVSLVDYPCCPVATFDYLKADGATELRKTKTISSEIVSLETRLEELKKLAAAEQSVANDGGFIMDQEVKTVLDGLQGAMTKQTEALAGIAELLKAQKPAVSQEPPVTAAQTAAPLTSEQVAAMVSKSVTDAMKSAFTPTETKPVATMTKAQDTGGKAPEAAKDLSADEFQKLNQSQQNDYLAKRLQAQPISEDQAMTLLSVLRS